MTEQVTFTHVFTGHFLKQEQLIPKAALNRSLVHAFVLRIIKVNGSARLRIKKGGSNLLQGLKHQHHFFFSRIETMIWIDCEQEAQNI